MAIAACAAGRFGSIADKVLHITHTPMLLVRGDGASARNPAHSAAARRLELCARQAIPLATELACENPRPSCWC